MPKFILAHYFQYLATHSSGVLSKAYHNQQCRFGRQSFAVVAGKRRKKR